MFGSSVSLSPLILVLADMGRKISGEISDIGMVGKYWISVLDNMGRKISGIGITITVHPYCEFNAPFQQIHSDKCLTMPISTWQSMVNNRKLSEQCVVAVTVN